MFLYFILKRASFIFKTAEILKTSKNKKNIPTRGFTDACRIKGEHLDFVLNTGLISEFRAVGIESVEMQLVFRC